MGWEEVYPSLSLSPLAVCVPNEYRALFDCRNDPYTEGKVLYSTMYPGLRYQRYLTSSYWLPWLKHGLIWLLLALITRHSLPLVRI